MRATMIPRTLAAVVLAGTMTLAGCSNDSTTKDGDDDRGPLDPYYQVFWGTNQWTADKAKADHLKREEVIAACMNTQGFDYTPMPWGDDIASPALEEEPGNSGPEWGTVAFAERYGYGVIEWPGMEDEPTEEPGSGGPEWVDPNQDYINSLNEPEQMAYYEALYGKHDDLGQEMDEDGKPIEQDIDWSKMGCTGKAMLEVTGQQPWEDPEFTDLAEALDGLYPSIEGSDEMAALNQEWATCLAEKGFTFASPGEADQHMYDLYSQELSPSEIDGDTYEEPTQEQKDAFQAKEIEQAVADFSCQEKVKYQDKLKETTFALQQKFVDEHKAQLDALLAKYGSETQEKK